MIRSLAFGQLEDEPSVIADGMAIARAKGKLRGKFYDEKQHTVSQIL